MRHSLALLLCDAVGELQEFYGTAPLPVDQFMSWMEKYPAQLVTLAVQVAWTASVEDSFQAGLPPDGPLDTIRQGLDLLADVVLTELSPVTRRKCEHLITELVHQRDVTRSLIQQRLSDNMAFTWLYQMRFYLDKSVANPLDCLSIRISDAEFPYGWEYLGVPDRLVQTPLTDRCYLTLTQALDNQLGGSPFGPAGTGQSSLPLFIFIASFTSFQVKRSLLRRWVSSLAGLYWSFAVTRRSISKLWVVFSWVYARLEPGDALTSSIVSKSVSSVQYRNKYRQYSKDWQQLLRTLMLKLSWSVKVLRSTRISVGLNRLL
jgi:hypothetical protein